MPWLELRSRASFGVLIEKQRARVAVHGKALLDANGMRTQNWPIPSDVGVERHSSLRAGEHNELVGSRCSLELDELDL